eukprot:m.54355 g.54355  ORF g.54355 m.54355 type:complete len:116 (-) comp11410_c0_seq3:81-428(-)
MVSTHAHCVRLSVSPPLCTQLFSLLLTHSDTRSFSTSPTRLPVISPGIAAMHGGFHVVQLGEDESSLDVVSSLDTDGELAYGASWCWDPKYPSLVGSCTFYNAERQLWTSFDTPQ